MLSLPASEKALSEALAAAKKDDHSSKYILISMGKQSKDVNSQ